LHKVQHRTNSGKSSGGGGRLGFERGVRGKGSGGGTIGVVVLSVKVKSWGVT